jgi:surface polysaccharide O-acyltransferase-like enzyme
MELTKKQMSMTKGVAILFMLLLHLFCRKDITGYYDVFININGVPLIYYLALFGDSCVAIYCFCSGYGLLINYKIKKTVYVKDNLLRLIKLYINYWIILFIFVLGVGFVMGRSNVYPGNVKTFLLSFVAINTEYNGAWWFLTTYIILVLLSPLINNIVIRYDAKSIIITSLIFYTLAYIQRIKGVFTIDNLIISWLIRQVSLLGTSQFPFIIGGIFAQKKLYTNVYNFFIKIKLKNVVLTFLISLLIVFHSFIESLFIAPFTGIAFICFFNLIEKPSWLNGLLNYLSKHSTNLWLIHMFFYMIFFKQLVFYPRYPIFIFPWLIILCLISSNMINIIYKPIINFLDNGQEKKVMVKSYN